MSDLNSSEILQKCKKEGYKLLARKDYTTFEFKNKLLQKGFDENVIESTINYFRELNFLNDRNYAFNYAENKIEDKNFSLLKLKTTLQKKGIDENIINEVTEHFFNNPESERELIKKEIELYKRKKNINEINQDNVHKLARYLYSKGFNESLIKSVLFYFD